MRQLERKRGRGEEESLQDPVVVAETELLLAHAAVPGHVEYHEHVGHPLRVQATK